MKRWVLAIAAVVLFVIVPLAAATSSQVFGPILSTSSAAPPLEVGKTYGFGVSGSDVTGKVLAEPRGNWLQVEVREGDKVHPVWINLLLVSFILPDPPEVKVGVACQAPALAY